MATFAPSAARRLAIAAPIPREPPVMSAIFPSSFFDIVLSFTLGHSQVQRNLLATPHMLVRHESKFCCSPDACQAHFVRLRRWLVVARSKHTLLSWEQCL